MALLNRSELLAAPLAVTKQTERHSLTRNWPVIALRDCPAAAESARPPAPWVKAESQGWRRLHAANK